MAIGILGRKVGMTQIYNESGDVVPVTVSAPFLTVAVTPAAAFASCAGVESATAVRPLRRAVPPRHHRVCRVVVTEDPFCSL